MRVILSEPPVRPGARDLTFGLPITQVIGRYRLGRLRGPSPDGIRGFGITPCYINDDSQNNYYVRCANRA